MTYSTASSRRVAILTFATLSHQPASSSVAISVQRARAIDRAVTWKKRKNRLKRLDPKAWIGYFVGYTLLNIYCIWVPFRNEVILIRDVIFNKEEVFNGNLKSLEDNARNVDLQELVEHLQRIIIPKDKQLTQSESLALTD